MAFATMRLVASRLSRSGACTAYIASLLNADSDELACTVHMDPSLPWLMALSMGMTSWPRTSPTITRSGFMRRPQRTRVARSISPSPSTFSSLASNATTSGCRSG